MNLKSYKGCLFFLSLCGVNIAVAAPHPLFNAKYIMKTARHGGDGTGFLVIRSTTPNKTYTYAGVSTEGPMSTYVEGCIKAEPWCLFQVNDKRPTIIKLKRPLLANAVPDTIKLKLSLNALSSHPKSEPLQSISTQEITVISSEPGRMIGYLYGWETPPSAQSIASAGYTHVLLSFGVFSTTSSGAINIDSLSGISSLSQYISDLHSLGVKVLLSIGGASTNIPNTTVSFNTALTISPANPTTFQINFVNAIKSLADTYGFDGFDFDIESGLFASNWSSTPSESFLYPNGSSNDYCSTTSYTNSACTSVYLASIINQIKLEYPNLMLTLAPQLANISATSTYNSTFGLYSSLIMQTYSALEWVGFQNYNSGCAYGVDGYCYPNLYGNPYPSLTSSPDSAVAFATTLLATWPQGSPMFFLPYTAYLEPSQVVIGYVVQNNNGQSDGEPAAVLPMVEDAIQCLRTGEYCYTYNPSTVYPYATYPGIGGVFAWSINYDADRNYEFARTLYPCVIQGNCTYTQP